MTWYGIFLLDLFLPLKYVCPFVCSLQYTKQFKPSVHILFCPFFPATPTAMMTTLPSTQTSHDMSSASTPTSSTTTTTTTTTTESNHPTPHGVFYVVANGTLNLYTYDRNRIFQGSFKSWCIII